MVRKKGSKYQLVSKTGKVLGTHATRKEAHAQEAAIKARRKKGK